MKALAPKTKINYIVSVQATIVYFLLFFAMTCQYAVAQSECSKLLTSYEPAEFSNLTITSPDSSMVFLSPVKGGDGNGDVPRATEGEYVYKIKWQGDTNHKVEIKHEWTDFTFDLAGEDYLLLDVYLASGTDLPSIMGFWDPNFDPPSEWLSANGLPRRVNEWRTISFTISQLNHVGLDDLDALVFENTEGMEEGTIYIDNLRFGRILDKDCSCPRQIFFSGYTWSVLQSDWEIGSGPSFFTDAHDDVWVDPNGCLHLSIAPKEDPNWYCSEVIANGNFGYGTYIFTVQDDIDTLDPNMILGAFILEMLPPGQHREIDFEFTRWGEPYYPCNCQFAIQPTEGKPENVYRFRIDYPSDPNATTHVFTWEPDTITFRSYHGEFNLVPENIIASWRYTGPDIPTEGCENPRLNLYLRFGGSPYYGEGAEVVIKNFMYLRDITPRIDLPDLAVFARHWLDTVDETSIISLIGADINRDGDVNLIDYAIFSSYWLYDFMKKNSTPQCWFCPTQCHGDADCDGDVDDDDLQIYEPAAGSVWDEWNYDPCADFNRDGRVDINDYTIFIANRNTNPPANCSTAGIWPPIL